MTDIEIAEHAIQTVNVRKLLTDLATKIVIDRGHPQPKLDAALVNQATSLLLQAIYAAEGGA